MRRGRPRRHTYRRGLLAARPRGTTAALSHGRKRSGAGRRPRFTVQRQIPHKGGASSGAPTQNGTARTGRLGRRDGRDAQFEGRPSGRPSTFRGQDGVMAQFIGRENVRKRLAPLEGLPGRTSYADGAVRIEAGGEVVVVRPPFGLGASGEHEGVVLEALFEALAADHVVAALLVRLGGYAVGVFEGERLVASKVGTRFVKGRHKKGGSSQARFGRRREEQARALVEAAAETAAGVLEPWRGGGGVVAPGGEPAPPGQGGAGPPGGRRARGRPPAPLFLRAGPRE